MPAKHQVSCINRHHHGEVHERIQNIGGVSTEGRWKLSENEAIQGIESGSWAFFVSVGGRSVDIIVASHSSLQACGHRRTSVLQLCDSVVTDHRSLLGQLRDLEHLDHGNAPVADLKLFNVTRL
jgi:Protein of unknown function (DUF3892)